MHKIGSKNRKKIRMGLKFSTELENEYINEKQEKTVSNEGQKDETSVGGSSVYKTLNAVFGRKRCITEAEINYKYHNDDRGVPGRGSSKVWRGEGTLNRPTRIP